jgi:glutamate-1-semialdehyde 2,1-aminomutase
MRCGSRAQTGRDAVLKFEGGFHGGNDYGVMSLFPLAQPLYPAPECSSAGVPRALEAEVLVAPFNDPVATRKILETYAERLAAIIVEPFQRVIDRHPDFSRACESCPCATASSSSSTRW